MFICDKIVGVKTTIKTIKMYFSKISIYNMHPQCHQKSTGYVY